MDGMKDTQTYTAQEIKMVMDLALLEQEKRLNQTWTTSLEKLTDKFATKTDLQVVDKKVDALQNWQNWAIRAVLFVVITGVLGVVITTSVMKG